MQLWHQRTGNPTRIKIQSTDPALEDTDQPRGAPRSWKIAAVVFSVFLLAVWIIKSNHLFKFKRRRREKRV